MKTLTVKRLTVRCFALLLAIFTVLPFFAFRTAAADQNPLAEKSILFVGDSICYAHVERSTEYADKAGWAGRIGTANGMDWMNNSVSGASVSNCRGTKTVLAQIEKSATRQYDLVILHGGVNDAWDKAPVGEMTSGFDPAKFDVSTFAGGLEMTIWKAVTSFPAAQLGYIVNFRLPKAKVESLHDMSAYFELAKKICDKWSVPYLDLYNDEEINKKLEVSTSTTYLYDSIHPSTAGYEVLYPVVEAWVKELAMHMNDETPLNVLPAVREWESESGKFIPKKEMKVVLERADLLSDAQKAIVGEYFEDILGYSVGISVGTPVAGDLYLTDSKDSSLGTEGYTLDAGEIVKVSAPGATGRLYGVITFLQSCYADGFFPCGKVRDYPAYPIRSGMIDVARCWIPMDYLTEMTKYFAWFKLNEIHIHINDNAGDGKGYYRLESDVPGLTSTQHYTKDEYRAYQKQMREYGIDVVTEIDTPSHARCFNAAVPSLMKDSAHLNIEKPETLQFVKDLWDEYITGDDPVFISKTVHIGTDEYLEGYNEQMRAYTDALIKFIRSRGLTPRFWAEFGKNGINGKTPVSGDAQANYWAVDLSDINVMLDMGYDIVNSCGPALYSVPGFDGNYFYDYFDLATMYKTWQVNYMGKTADTAIDPDHPKLLGVSFAQWNEQWFTYSGFSRFDIFDRLRYQVCFVGEKGWCGMQTAGIDARNFVERFNKLSVLAGGTNPARTAALPITEKTVGDTKSVGFDYLLDADLTVSDYDCDVFSGEDGRLYINKKGNPCFDRETYTFTFPCVLPKGDVNVKLYCDNKETLLIVDDTWFYEPVNNHSPKVIHSSTFVLPLETIGSKGCKVKAFTVDKPDFTPYDYLENQNLALNKPTEVSGQEVPDKLLKEWAVDGDPATRLSFANQVDEQWLVVDLEKVYTVDHVVIKFFEHTANYELLVSTDGKNFTKVYELKDGKSGDRNITDDITFTPVKARYVKYVQKSRWYMPDYHKYYSGGISEFEVYAGGADHTELLEQAKKSNDKTVNEILKEIEAYRKKSRMFIPHLEGLIRKLQEALDEAGKLPKGDVNGDGKVDAFDYMMTKTTVLGTYVPEADAKERMDVNTDGSVDAFDYQMIKSVVLGTLKL